MMVPVFLQTWPLPYATYMTSCMFTSQGYVLLHRSLALIGWALLHCSPYGAGPWCYIPQCTKFHRHYDKDNYTISAFNPCEAVSCGEHGVCVVVQGPAHNFDDLTGQCRCKDAYTGPKCDQGNKALSYHTHLCLSRFILLRNKT